MAESVQPLALYDAATMRRLDAAAIELGGVDAHDLMERAGAAAFAELRERWPDCAVIACICGAGNNGGDGYVVARLAHAAGLTVQVIQIGGTDRLSEAASACLGDLMAVGIEPGHLGPTLRKVDVVVDALLGVGVSREVRGDYARAIAAMNDCAAPVLSLDVPSGLDATTGCRRGSAVHADVTVSFIAAKCGLYTADAPNHCGDIVIADLQVVPAAHARFAPMATMCDALELATHWGRRARTAHKGDHGHVLLVGGAPGFSGAIRLAGEAALRSGAGLVSLATDPNSVAAANATRPELMVHGVTAPGDLVALFERATVIGIGPGLGMSRWASSLFAAVLETRVPLVVDADALNLLAREPTTRRDWVLTPHPGEAARLLACTSAEIHADRFAAVTALQEKYGGTVVLKGAGTVIAGPDARRLVRTGNPGMGSGGMGDVLTGVIAALLAQGLARDAAAAIGAALHGEAGDRAALDGGERGLVASDLLPVLRRLVNP